MVKVIQKGENKTPGQNGKPEMSEEEKEMKINY